MWHKLRGRTGTGAVLPFVLSSFEGSPCLGKVQQVCQDVGQDNLGLAMSTMQICMIGQSLEIRATGLSLGNTCNRLPLESAGTSLLRYFFPSGFAMHRATSGYVYVLRVAVVTNTCHTSRTSGVHIGSQRYGVLLSKWLNRAWRLTTIGWLWVWLSDGPPQISDSLTLVCNNCRFSLWQLQLASCKLPVYGRARISQLVLCTNVVRKVPVGRVGARLETGAYADFLLFCGKQQSHQHCDSKYWP